MRRSSELGSFHVRRYCGDGLGHPAPQGIPVRTIPYLEPVVAELARITVYHQTILLWQVLAGIIIVGSGVAQTLLSTQRITTDRASTE